MYYWMNTETGELFSYEEVYMQFIKDYNGNNEFNVVNFFDVFVPTSIEIVP